MFKKIWDELLHLRAKRRFKKKFNTLSAEEQAMVLKKLKQVAQLQIKTTQKNA